MYKNNKRIEDKRTYNVLLLIILSINNNPYSKINV